TKSVRSFSTTSPFRRTMMMFTTPSPFSNVSPAPAPVPCGDAEYFPLSDISRTSTRSSGKRRPPSCMTRLAISKSNAFTFIPGFTSSMYLSCPKSDSAAASRMMSSSSGYFTCRMSIRNGVTSSNSSLGAAGCLERGGTMSLDRNTSPRYPSLRQPHRQQLAPLQAVPRPVRRPWMLDVDRVIGDVKRTAFLRKAQVIGRELVHDHERLASLRDHGRYGPLPRRDVEVEAGDHVEVVGRGDHHRLVPVLSQPILDALLAVVEHRHRDKRHRGKLLLLSMDTRIEGIPEPVSGDVD